VRYAHQVVHLLTDKATVRRHLEKEREWALYALADLGPGLFEQCEWRTCGDGLVLVFHGLAIRPIFAMGCAADVREILSVLPTPSGYLNLEPHQLPAADGLYAYRQRHDMQRMILRDFAPARGQPYHWGPQTVQRLRRSMQPGQAPGSRSRPCN
jgi:hypothetical protein